MYKVNVDDELFCFQRIRIVDTHDIKVNPATRFPEAVVVGCRVVGVAFNEQRIFLTDTISRKEAVSITSSIFNSRKRKFTIKGGKLCP